MYHCMKNGPTVVVVPGFCELIQLCNWRLCTATLSHPRHLPSSIVESLKVTFWKLTGGQNDVEKVFKVLS